MEINKKVYDEINYPFNSEINKIIGICIEVHKTLGRGFLEVVYKDALEIEFKKAGIDFEREKEFIINYKGVNLMHRFYADFVLLDNIILEIKAQKCILEEFGKQVLNYLAVSGCKVGIVVNFGEEIMKVKKYVL